MNLHNGFHSPHPDPLEEQIKPCPFCGYELPLDEGLFDPTLGQTLEPEDDGYCPDYIISCSNCGAGTAPKETKAEVLAAWNQRA